MKEKLAKSKHLPYKHFAPHADLISQWFGSMFLSSHDVAQKPMYHVKIVLNPTTMVKSGSGE